MKLDVILLPQLLRPEHLSGRAVVVFDVIRATTTMNSALAAGVKEIRVFGDLDAAARSARDCAVPHLLCGERNAEKPPGFDLGNSPAVFTPELHRGQTLLMSTTNGTRAILAARGAARMFVGAIVNAGAAAAALLDVGRDVTLLCAGTEGEISAEDILGAGAVIDALRARTDVELPGDAAWLALQAFGSCRETLHATLTGTRGGRNVIRAGLAPDLDFCARLDSLGSVGVVNGDTPVVTLWGHEK